MKRDTAQENWGEEIADLNEFFKRVLLPNQKIKLSRYKTIINPTKFIESHMAIVSTYNGKRIALPYLNRLRELKIHINNK